MRRRSRLISAICRGGKRKCVKRWCAYGETRSKKPVFKCWDHPPTLLERFPFQEQLRGGARQRGDIPQNVPGSDTLGGARKLAAAFAFEAPTPSLLRRRRPPPPELGPFKIPEPELASWLPWTPSFCKPDNIGYCGGVCIEGGTVVRGPWGAQLVGATSRNVVLYRQKDETAKDFRAR